MSSIKPQIHSAFSFETQEEVLDIPQKSKPLLIGIPKETAFQENRIGLIPEAVSVLVANGHEVLMQSNAAEGSRYSDNDYAEAGAQIVVDKEAVYNCPILVKTAPPVETDLPFLQMHQTIISPLHLTAVKKELMEQLMAKKITALALENIKDENQNYPILRSMGEITGSAVMLIAGQYLSNFNQGKGILLGGVSGVPPTKVVIIGADIIGEFATRNALALGASVKVFDNNVSRLQRLQNNLGQRVWTSVLEPKILAKQLKTCEVAVGALRNDFGRAPIVVTEEMVAAMRPGSIIIDAASTMVYPGAGIAVSTGTAWTTSLTAPSGAIVGTTDTQTLTNKRVTPRIGTTTSSATITPTSDLSDQYNVTALATTATFAIPSGTPTDGQKLSIRIKDSGSGQTISWTTTAGGYRVIGTTLPTTIAAGKTIYVGCVYNAADTFWDVVAVATQA
jgi:alanine dehydrogenase